jgi:uncharacterized protein YndB with AHSA1/START domain
MQIRLKYGVYVDKPPAEVFNFLADPDRMPEWQSSLFEVKGKKGMAGNNKLQKGAKVNDRRNVLGKEIDSEWEVAEIDEPKRLVLRLTAGLANWETTYTLSPLDNGTYLAADGNGDLGDVPMSSVAAHRTCQRMFEDDLTTLSDILETGGPRGGKK